MKNDDKFERVVRRLDPGGRLVGWWELKGGIAAEMVAVEFERAEGHRERVVVRQHGEADLCRNAQIGADEFKLLQRLYAAGVVVPSPYYCEQDDGIFATPYMVLEYIEGKTEFAPKHLSDLIQQCARQLAILHAVDYEKLELSFLPRLEQIYAKKLERRPKVVDDSLDEGRIRDVLEVAWPWAQRNAAVLLHGDFWWGNILWREGQLVAVIDWTDAKIGDPLADVAISRLDTLWAYGWEAMEEFTRECQRVMAIDWMYLPYWDLCAALRPAFHIAEWAVETYREKEMRAGHRLFVRQAFEKLGMVL